MPSRRLAIGGMGGVSDRVEAVAIRTGSEDSPACHYISRWPWYCPSRPPRLQVAIEIAAHPSSLHAIPRVHRARSQREIKRPVRQPVERRTPKVLRTPRLAHQQCVPRRLRRHRGLLPCPGGIAGPRRYRTLVLQRRILLPDQRCHGQCHETTLEPVSSHGGPGIQPGLRIREHITCAEGTSTCQINRSHVVNSLPAPVPPPPARPRPYMPPKRQWRPKPASCPPSGGRKEGPR